MKKIELECPIYTFHIDFAGHVSNIVYIQWMEVGRLELLKAAGLPVDRLVSDGIAPILAGTEIAYRVPLYLGDHARLEIWVSELRRASARMEFRFYKDGDTLCATGAQKGLFVHRESMRPYRMPREWRAALEPFVAAEPD